MVEELLRRLVGVHVGLAEGFEDVVVGVPADDLLDGLDGGVDRRRRVGGAGPAAAAGAASHDRTGDRRTLRRGHGGGGAFDLRRNRIKRRAPLGLGLGFGRGGWLGAGWAGCVRASKGNGGRRDIY